MSVHMLSARVAVDVYSEEDRSSAVHNLASMNSAAHRIFCNPDCMMHETFHCCMQAPQLNPYFLHSEPQFGWSSCQNVGDDGLGTRCLPLCIVLMNAFMPATTLQTSHGIVIGSRLFMLS